MQNIIDISLNVVLKFIETCCACPEQYDVYLDNKQIGYVRLRWGIVSASYPNYEGLTVYREQVGDGLQGEFSNEEDRTLHLTNIALALYTQYLKCTV